MTSVSQCCLREVTFADVAVTATIEQASYPADEAATPEKLAYRCQHAAPFFKVLEATLSASSGGVSVSSPPTSTASAATETREVREIVGFICGTLSRNALTHESMSLHEADGVTLCIHSVVIRADLRRRGLAEWMLNTYCEDVTTQNAHVRQILLLTHEHNQKLYERCGFVSQGVSSVSHGSEVWIEMKRVVSHTAAHPKYFHVDAFTGGVSADAKLRSGNPAGVIILPKPRVLPTAWHPDDATLANMQRIAAEVKLPVTAFLMPAVDGTYFVRYFTCEAEIPLCGHASLATGHAFWTHGIVPTAQTSIVLVNKDGLNVVLRKLNAEEQSVHFDKNLPTPTIQLNFAADVHTPVEINAELLELLPAVFGLPADRLAIGEGKGISFIGKNSKDMLFVVSHDVFTDMRVDTAAVHKLPGRIVSITTRGGAPVAAETAAETKVLTLRDGHACSIPLQHFHMVSRCFSPRTGTPEDTVCGAAHCGILPTWATMTALPEAPTFVTAFQASPRGGVLYLSLVKDRVVLRGDATTFASGRLLISV